MYQEILDDILSNVDIDEELLNCSNYECEIHNEEIEILLNKINSAIITASDFSLPRVSKPKKKKSIIPGWNHYVKPLKEQSIFLTNLWKENGCILGDEFDKNRKLARSRYHRAIKFVMFNKDRIIKEKISNNLCNKNFKEFWKEVRKIKSTKINYPTVVDNIQGTNQINKLFHDQYKSLYNMNYDINDNTFISEYISNNIIKCKNKECSSSHEVELKHVIEALKNLNPDKKDFIYGMSSNHFIKDTTFLNTKLCQLFNLFLIHGFTTIKINSSIILPLPKNNKKSLSLSTNYRAISLNSIMCKIIEYIVKMFLEKYVKTSNNQFGYKKNLSTNSCSFLMTETINYYINNNSRIYALFLDASKAFDRVTHNKLFMVMISKNVCPLILRLIVKMYNLNNARVKWSGYLSPVFAMRNGVKQGGVLSPYLFSLYLEPLISKVNNCRHGCHIGEISYNILVYADDIVLLSPSITALKYMINICEEYSRNFDLIFNSNKCELVIFCKDKFVKNSKPIILMNNSILKISNSYTHLGINITNNNNQIIDFNNIIRDLKIKCNIIKNEFSKLSYLTKVELFNSHCMSLFGCCLWKIESKNFQRIQIEWRKCIRLLLNLPYNTHNNLIPGLIKSRSVDVIINNRFLNFYFNGLNSDNELKKIIFLNSWLLNYGSVLKNIAYISRNYRISYLNIFEKERRKFYLNIPHDELWLIK